MTNNPFDLAAMIVDLIYDAGMSSQDEPMTIAHALAIIASECAPKGKGAALIDELAVIAKDHAAKLEGFYQAGEAEVANENVTSIFSRRRK